MNFSKPLFLLLSYCWLLLFTVLNVTASGIDPKAEDPKKVTVSGYVKDAKTGEILIGATIFSPELKQGSTTNLYGFYSLSLPEGSYNLSISYIGYVAKTVPVTLVAGKNQKFDVELGETENSSNDVVIEAERLNNQVKNMEMSVARLDVATLKKIPALLGEVDVIRSVQLLPGVTSVGEGASGFNVRGGNIDQNLILLDEAPVYNSSHVFGLFSVFNPDAVKDVKLYKGGIPAQYGGRLSSILDIRLKEGNNKQPSINAGIGLIFSRLSFEAPIVKDKGSFIVAARRSYFDVFLPLAPDKDLKKTTLYFYDFTAKANYTINNKNKVFLSGYLGRDVFNLGGNAGLNWGNNTVSARWNSIISDKLFMNLTAYYSRYDYQFKASTERDAFNLVGTVINKAIKPEFVWYPNSKHTITFGAQSIYNTFKPISFEATSFGVSNALKQPDKYSLENALYASDEFEATERLSFQYGLRYSLYNYLGPGTTYDLGDTTPGIRRPTSGPINQPDNASIAFYQNLEPRFSAKYELTASASIKASYNRMAQYINLITNATAALPIDSWVPASKYVKPQLADQVAIGYFRNFTFMNDNKWEFSLEGFYKKFYNQIDYIDGANLRINPRLEADLLFGSGRAYGLEFYLKKNTGKFTGWISYTYSRSYRTIEGINNGTEYPTRFDKPNFLNVVMIYDVTKKINVGATVVYSTGAPTTFFSSKYNFQGLPAGVVYNNSRNNYRIGDYFRIDLSATINNKPRTGDRWYKNWESSWVFSAYNVLGRRNPFGIYQQPNPDNLSQTQAIQFSVFGSIIPSVTYNIKF